MTPPEMTPPEMTGRFRNRAEAGKALGDRLRDRIPAGAVVLGLARGGLPVAAEVAHAIGAQLDVCVVRKLGAPVQPEFAFGAIAENEATFIDATTVAALGLSDDAIARVRQAETRELVTRARRYRGDRPLVDVRERNVVLVDDGLATGATMRAAVRLVKQRGATSVTVAVPVGAPESVRILQNEADVVCLHAPPDFGAVGYWYADFRPPSDDEISELLSR
jgi:predicted phosphoribosyltransferase